MNHEERMKVTNEVNEYLAENGITNVEINGGLISIIKPHEENNFSDSLKNNLKANIEIIEQHS